MKHLILFVALCLMGVLRSNAQSTLSQEISYAAKSMPFATLVSDTGAMRIQLYCDNPAGERVRISIRSEQGEVYAENTAARNIAKSFDLHQLEDGLYEITVAKGTERLQKQILLESSLIMQRRQVLQ